MTANNGTNGEGKPGFLTKLVKAVKTYGFKNVAEGFYLTRNKWYWDVVQGNGLLRTRYNTSLINSLIYKIPTRPNQLSTLADYPSWESLTDRTYSARHLPPVSATAALPPSNRVAELFRRPAGRKERTGKSTVLFTYFAQWFTDGFLRTDYENPLKNTSNHDIDLSNLYGLDRASTEALRSKSGGKLKSQVINGEEFPPAFYREDGRVVDEFATLPMAKLLRGLEYLASAPAGAPPHVEARTKLFAGFQKVFARKPFDKLMFAMGGDRINSNPGFVAMNVLFLREHNRVCDELKEVNPGWDDERLFQTARVVLIALLTKLVVEEYINHITPYRFQFVFDAGRFESQHWYRQNWMAVEFNLLYRWHSLTPNAYTIGGREVALEDTFFNNGLLVARGLGPMLDDASRQPAGQIGVLNTPSALVPVEQGGVELGRAARLASYNDYRQLCGFPRVTSFDQITENPTARDMLKDLYGSVDNVEYYAGIFAEDALPNSALSYMIGRLVSVDAFSQALTSPLFSRNLFREQTFSATGLDIITRTKSLSEIVRRNTPAGSGPYHITMNWDATTPAPR